MALTPGARLGPYEIGALIGGGGMGQVYRAVDTRLKRAVAIKVIASRYVDSPELRSRFRAEAEAIAALTHPHICRLYDVGQQDGIDFLVMEYLEGETLAARLLRGRLPLSEALAHAHSLADALDQSHRQGIIHRDVKPGNVMLTPSGPKLLDFGVARLRLAGVATGVATQSTVPGAPDLTKPGGAVGTWRYMAPEQVRGEPADARSDVFALGIVVYEMLTGRRPFVGATQQELLGAILEESWTPDRRTLFFRAEVNGQWDLWTATPGGGPPQRYLSSPFDERYARVAPDGRWLAYISDESGRAEAYIRALDGPAAREQVSSRGGVAVAWAPDSQRLYFRGDVADNNATGIWMVELRPGGALRFSEPQLLFTNPGFQPNFDVSRDGKRFLMVAADRRPPVDRLELTLNLLRAPRPAESSR